MAVTTGESVGLNKGSPCSSPCPLAPDKHLFLRSGPFVAWPDGCGGPAGSLAADIWVGRRHFAQQASSVSREVAQTRYMLPEPSDWWKLSFYGCLFLLTGLGSIVHGLGSLSFGMLQFYPVFDICLWSRPPVQNSKEFWFRINVSPPLFTFPYFNQWWANSRCEV